MRAHLLRPLQDGQGNLVLSATIRVLNPGTTDLIVQTLYVDDSSSLTLSNPVVITDGWIDVYLASPQRVRLGVTVGTAPEQYVEDVDVTTAGSDSSHLGVGGQSLQVGLSALASGASSTAAGVGSAASGGQSTAVGHAAVASGEQATAVGEQASSASNGATSLGTSSTAAGPQSTAVGSGAIAPYSSSTAIGSGAVATVDHQVMLGTTNDVVEHPGGTILTSPGGIRFQLVVTDSGQLLAQRLAAVQPPAAVIPSDGF